MTRFQIAWRESVGIVVCSLILAFSYTFVQQKGLFAKSAPQQATLGTLSEAPTLIDVQEALDLYQGGEALFIDARHEFDYNLGHIRGSVNLPLAEFDNRAEFVSSLPKDKILITYCDGANCNSSIELASKLIQAGFPQVRVFFAGWNEWQGQRLPMAKE